MCGLQVVAGERLDAPQFVSPRALSAFPGPGLDVSTRSGTAKPNTGHTIPPLGLGKVDEAGIETSSSRRRGPHSRTRMPLP